MAGELPTVTDAAGCVAGPCVVGEAGKPRDTQPVLDNNEPSIHLCRVANQRLATKALGDDSSTWPEPTVEHLFTDKLGPQGCFATKDQRLLCRGKLQRLMSALWLKQTSYSFASSVFFNVLDG